jgi:hypothetical protein
MVNTARLHSKEPAAHGICRSLSRLTGSALVGFVTAFGSPTLAEAQPDTQLLRRVEALESQAANVPAPQPSGPLGAASGGGLSTPAQLSSVSPSTASLDRVTAGQVSVGAPLAEEGEEIVEGIPAAELTLVEEGAMLLPPWTVEVEPEFIYRFTGSDTLRIVETAGVPGVIRGPTVAQRDFRRDRFDGRLNARLGLPYDLQADVSVPYLHVRERTVLAGVPSVEEESGIGDVEVGLTKQLLEERGGFPGILGGVRWKAATGEADLSGISPGTGTDSLQASLTAVRRLDPLVLFGSLSHTHNFDGTISGRHVDPGNLFGVKLGAVLAASPEASITLAIDTVFVQKTELDGQPLFGSDGVSSVLELGVGVRVLERTLLTVKGGIGITEAAPDLRLGVALPTRF